MLCSPSIGTFANADTDAYFDALKPAFHNAFHQWLSIDVALAHYRAIKSLKLDPEAFRENGRNLAEKLHNSFLGTLIRGLRVGGVVSPLTIPTRSNLRECHHSW